MHFGYVHYCMGYAPILYMCIHILCMYGFPGGSDGKASVYNAGDLGLILGLGRSPGEGNGNPLQYYCLENPMDSGAWQATCSPWGCKESDTISDFASSLPCLGLSCPDGFCGISFTAVWHQASSSTSLCLNFFTCEMGTIAGLAAQEPLKALPSRSQAGP